MNGNFDDVINGNQQRFNLLVDLNGDINQLNQLIFTSKHKDYNEISFSHSRFHSCLYYRNLTFGIHLVGQKSSPQKQGFDPANEAVAYTHHQRNHCMESMDWI